MNTALATIAACLCQNAKLAPLTLDKLLLKTDAVVICVPTKDPHSVDVTSILCAKSGSIKKGILKLGDSSFQFGGGQSYAFKGVSKPTVLFLKFASTEKQWTLTNSAQSWFEASGAGVAGTPYYQVDNRLRIPKKHTHISIRGILFPKTLKRLRVGVYSKPDVLATISKLFKSLRGPKNDLAGQSANNPANPSGNRRDVRHAVPNDDRRRGLVWSSNSSGLGEGGLRCL